MNTEEVVEMINAITEGKYYARSFETTPNCNSISIETGTNAEDERGAPNEFWFSSFDAEFLAKIDNPRTAREIAGALIAWADCKDGSLTQTANRIISDIHWGEVLSGQAVNPIEPRDEGATQNIPPKNCKAPRVWQVSETHRRRHRENGECLITPSAETATPKADWYTRNANHMSEEALRRNFDDLMLISKMKSITDNERADANKAKDIVWVALRKVNPKTKQCNNCLLLDGPNHACGSRENDR